MRRCETAGVASGEDGRGTLEYYLARCFKRFLAGSGDQRLPRLLLRVTPFHQMRLSRRSALSSVARRCCWRAGVKVRGSGIVHCVDPFDGSGNAFSTPHYRAIIDADERSLRRRFDANLHRAGLDAWVCVHEGTAEIRPEVPSAAPLPPCRDRLRTAGDSSSVAKPWSSQDLVDR